MKRVFLLTLTIAALYSCDKLLDFAINHTFEDSYEVNLPADSDTTYSQSFTFDASDNQEIEDNIDHLNGYSLKSLKLSISDYVGGDDVDGSFSFSFKNAAGNTIGDGVTTVTLENLAGWSSSGDKTDVPLTQGTIDAVQNELAANNAVTVMIAGSVTEVPVQFTAHVFLEVEVNVSP